MGQVANCCTGSSRKEGEQAESKFTKENAKVMANNAKEKATEAYYSAAEKVKNIDREQVKEKTYAMANSLKSYFSSAVEQE